MDIPEFPGEATAQRVRYEARYGIVICLPCGQAIAPGAGVRRHLKDYHQAWPLDIRRAIVAYTQSLPLRIPEDVPSPATQCHTGLYPQPVLGLSTYDGWKCLICSRLYPAEASVLRHNRVQHQWTKAKGPGWVPTVIQTLFQGPRQQFFEVRAGAAHERRQRGAGDRPALEEAAERLLETSRGRREGAERQAARVAAVAVPASEQSPWMRKTRWAGKFGSRRLGAVAALAERPGKDEGTLQLVWDSVGRVLEQCRASVAAWHEEEEDGDGVLRWLASPQAAQCSLKPFNGYYARATHTRNTQYWAGLLCYLLRLVHTDDRHGHVFRASDEQALRRIWACVELDDSSCAELDQQVFDLSIQLWMHEARADSRSAIIHFTAILGIDRTKDCFLTPQAYGTKLAALLYCARVLIFEHALPAARRRDIGDPHGQFLELHHCWLVDGPPTPFNYIDSLLAYALGAGKDVGGMPCVVWSNDEQTLIYKGEQVALAKLQRFADEMCAATETLLQKDLLFLPDSQAAGWYQDLQGIVDDMTETAAGYWFGADRRNGLADGAAQALRRLVASDDAHRLLKLERGELAAKPKGWQRYHASFHRFRTLLFLLVHLCSGAPARGPEILSTRYANAAHAPRNLFVCDGQVAIVTAYHKSQSITGQHKVIARFLPERIGQLLVAYTTVALPLRDLLDRHQTFTPAGGYIWADAAGPWGTARVTEALAQETTLQLGIRIKIQDWRHIAKAIDRKHVRQACGTPGGRMEREDDDAEGDEEIYDLAAGHSSHTADHVYGLDATMLRSLSDRTLSAFRTVSGSWHRFWGLEGKASSRKRHADEPHAPAKRRRGAGPRGPVVEPIQPVAEQVQASLRRLLGEGACFRSAEQEAAIQEVIEGSSPLVVILPPGGGKSLIFQLPASLPSAQTTIVVLPYRALVADLVKRSRRLGIASDVWRDGGSPAARLLFVSAEAAACNDAFYTFAASLQVQGRLDRIVVDECHVALAARSYRQQLIHLDRLRTIPCPLLYLTGTLPLMLQPELEDAFLLGPPEQGLRYIRASTDRRNVEYTVEACESAAAAGQRIATLVRNACATPGSRRRVVVFCRGRDDCEQMAVMLRCRPYHRMLAQGDQDEALAAWADGEEQVIVATTALGTGVDIAGIDLIIHSGRPHGIVDFVQEVGRGGRADGTQVQSIIVLTRHELRWLQSAASEEGDFNRDAMRSYLTETTCRRQRLTTIMDGRAIPCEEHAESRRCDLCQRREGEERSAAEGAAAEACHRKSQAEQQAQRYASGPQLWQQRRRQQGGERQRIEESMRAIGDGCAACWLREGETPGHRTRECEWLAEAWGEGYERMQKQVRYEKGCHCCFLCGLPGDWCEDYSAKRRCQQTNVVLGLALAYCSTPEGRQWVAGEARGESREAALQWMGRKAQVGGSRGSNVVRAAVRAAEQAIRRRGAGV